jgi:hypothetical protein
MNQSQQQKEKPSFLEWYSNKTGMVMDKLCFSCPDNYSSEIQEFNGVSSYEEQKAFLRRCYASYELPGDFQDYSIHSTHRRETLPIQYIRRTHWLQSNSFIDNVNDDDASREQAPMTPPPAKTSIFKMQKRENSCDSLDVFCSPAVHKPTLHPPISPSDTYTTVSMSMRQSYMDEDEHEDEDWRSTTSDQVVSQYDCLGKKTLSIGNLGKENSMRNLGCNPPTRKQVTSNAA